MCLICIHLDAGKLDPWEAAQNRVELVHELDEEHLAVLDDKIRIALINYLDGLNAEDEGECSQ
jgi:hypothetical protein